MRKLLLLLAIAGGMRGAVAQKKIRGIITDASGAALPWATITEAESGRSTISGEDGRFSMRLSQKDARLIVSSVSYKTDTVTAADGMKMLLQRQGDLAEAIVTYCGIRRTRCPIGCGGGRVRVSLSRQKDPVEIRPVMARVYPNPAVSKVTLDAGTAVREGFLTDMGGRRLQHFEGSDKAAPISIRLDGLPAGVYLLRYFAATGGWLTEKVVVAR